MKKNNAQQARELSLLGAILFLLFLLLFLPMISSAKSNLAIIDVNTGANYSTSVESDSKVEITNTTIQSSNTEVEVDSDTDAELKLNVFGIAVVSATQVNTDADLKVFSENVTKKNGNVAKVEVSAEGKTESEVKVIYRHRGKLLGFIPVTVRSKTEVLAEADANLAVSSHLSWWSFLVAKTNYDRAELESQIRENTIVKANAKVDASAGAKARVAEAVIAEIQAQAMTQLSASS